MTRTLTLLFVVQVCAEWVEISQHHYRKPIRTHSHFTTPERAIQVEDTTKPWSYNNRSVTEYNWNKSPANTNIGNVKRVQHVGSTTKTTEKIIYENPDLDDDTDSSLKPNYGSPRPNIELNEHGKQKGVIVKVPNQGNIQRVQLSNSPVKSPSIDFKGNKEITSNNRYKSTTQPYDLETEVNEFEDNQKHENNNRRIYVNEVKQHSTERTFTFPPDDDEDLSHFAKQVKKGSKQDNMNHTAIKNVYFIKPTFITEEFTDYETQLNRFYKSTHSKSSEVASKINMLTTESTVIEKDFSTKKKKLTTVTTEKISTRHDHNKVTKITDFETQSHENKVQYLANDDKPTDFNTNAKASIANPVQEAQSENYLKTDKKGHTAKETQTENGKAKTMENLIQFMRVVADTISRNSRRSFGGKMQYLHELKDSILANIEERIDTTWPDDDSAGARRHSRSAHASPRGHVQFPSSESALMTISFLTFAVFLIKLVLQVIQTYKHKAMMVAPLVVASSGRNVFAQRDHDGHH